MSTENKVAILKFYEDSLYPEVSEQDRTYKTFIGSGLKRNDRILLIKKDPIGFKFFTNKNKSDIILLPV